MTHLVFSTQAFASWQRCEQCTEASGQGSSSGINYFEEDNTLEEQSGKYHTLRLGFRQVKGLREEDIKKLITGRISAHTSINELRDAGVPEAALESLRMQMRSAPLT